MDIASTSDRYSFELAPNVDITNLPLTAEEGFVVARMIGRRMTMVDIVREGLPQSRVQLVVESLIKKGALVRIGGDRRMKSDDPYEGIIFGAAELSEAADITEDQKKRILYVDMHLDQWSHYKLLGLKRTATAADVKAGYFKASKEFHPDAYFRKNLGTYKDRVDRIFRSMKIAYDALSDAKKREQYDATVTVIELTPEEEAEVEKIAEKKREAQRLEAVARERDERNEQRMKESRLKRNPMVDRIKKGREYLKLAEEAHKAGKLDEAANHARLALSCDPEGLKVPADKLILEAQKARATVGMKRVHQILASPADTRDLQAELNRVIDEAADTAAATLDPLLLVEVAKALVAVKRPVRAAKLAQQATDADPRNPRAWEAFAEACAADNKWALVARATDRWLKIEPNAPRAKELVKEAKRNT
jgi:hypothetical protein